MGPNKISESNRLHKKILPSTLDWTLDMGPSTLDKKIDSTSTIQTATLNARKIPAGNPDLATITRIEMFIPVAYLPTPRVQKPGDG